jgi:hypothetical protein
VNSVRSVAGAQPTYPHRGHSPVARWLWTLSTAERRLPQARHSRKLGVIDCSDRHSHAIRRPSIEGDLIPAIAIALPDLGSDTRDDGAFPAISD